MEIYSPIRSILKCMESSNYNMMMNMTRNFLICSHLMKKSKKWLTSRKKLKSQKWKKWNLSNQLEPKVLISKAVETDRIQFRMSRFKDKILCLKNRYKRELDTQPWCKIIGLTICGRKKLLTIGNLITILKN